jgi:excisionase family DNA binding protein
MESTLTPAQLLTEKQAAEYLGLARGTLSVWRCRRRYPLRFIRVGRAIRYRQPDLDAFLASRSCSGMQGRDADVSDNDT